MSVVERAQVLLLQSMYHSDSEELLTRHVEIHRLHAPTQEAIHDAIRAASAVVVRYPCRLSTLDRRTPDAVCFDQATHKLAA